MKTQLSVPDVENLLRTEFVPNLLEQTLATESVPLLQAIGRVLATDLIAPINVPAHNNSAMDGYAFDSNQLLLARDASKNQIRLEIAGRVLAGGALTLPIKSQSCIRIMTGAVMPDGFDTVIAQELVQTDGNYISFSSSSVRAKTNCRLAGEDIPLGSIALEQGTKLNVPRLGLIASLGLTHVAVYRRLKVAYFSTGNEIMAPGTRGTIGSVYDSNRFTMLSLISQLGCQGIDLGTIADERAALETAFAQAAASADVVITSGGVSVGEADLTKSVMQQIGDVRFLSIAIRPGKPLVLGKIARTLLFGLPGNPVSAIVSFLAFVRPALIRAMGCSQTSQTLMQAQTTTALSKQIGRTQYLRASVSRSEQGWLQVTASPDQSAGTLSTLAHSDCFIILHHDQTSIQADQWVDIMMFDGTMPS
jgi:molybdopterin molybdotransferase